MCCCGTAGLLLVLLVFLLESCSEFRKRVYQQKCVSTGISSAKVLGCSSLASTADTKASALASGGNCRGLPRSSHPCPPGCSGRSRQFRTRLTRGGSGSLRMSACKRPQHERKYAAARRMVSQGDVFEGYFRALEEALMKCSIVSHCGHGLRIVSAACQLVIGSP